MIVLPDNAGGQGIVMKLHILTGPQPADSRIRIDGWQQWQPAFDYSGSAGGVWKG